MDFALIPAHSETHSILKCLDKGFVVVGKISLGDPTVSLHEEVAVLLEAYDEGDFKNHFHIGILVDSLDTRECTF